MNLDNKNQNEHLPQASRPQKKPIASISGIVVHGKGRGRTVGMPTANIQADLINEAEGVYASIVHIASKDCPAALETFLGVTNIGTRPTVDNEKTIETHILDFDRDIYGEKIAIDLIEFLRGIKKFGSLEEVKKQVEKDIARTREIAAETKLPAQTGNLDKGETPEDTGSSGEDKTSKCTVKMGGGETPQNKESKK